jgi:predicted Zn finger-like uncharacterized protein
MTSLDGNAVAGLLYDAYGEEMTAAVGTCGACGTRFRLADAAVYQGSGTVLRCPHCGHAAMVIIEKGDVPSVDAEGLAALDRAW